MAQPCETLQRLSYEAPVLVDVRENSIFRGLVPLTPSHSRPSSAARAAEASAVEANVTNAYCRWSSALSEDRWRGLLAPQVMDSLSRHLAACCSNLVPRAGLIRAKRAPWWA